MVKHLKEHINPLMNNINIIMNMKSKFNLKNQVKLIKNLLKKDIKIKIMIINKMGVISNKILIKILMINYLLPIKLLINILFKMIQYQAA
jgi:hypothetical protein